MSWGWALVAADILVGSLDISVWLNEGCGKRKLAAAAAAPEAVHQINIVKTYKNNDLETCVAGKVQRTT